MKTRQLKRGTILLTIASCMVLSTQAQEKENTPKKDSSEEVEVVVIPTKTGKIEVRFYPSDSSGSSHKGPKKTEPRDFWSGVDFGFGGYLNPTGGTTLPTSEKAFEINQAKSAYIGFNFYELGIPIYKTNVVLLTGIGLDYNSYRFRADHSPFAALDSMGNSVQHDYITNRLKTFYATVPLMLGFDFSKPHKNGVHIAAGVVAGVRIGSYTKEKYSEGSKNIKTNTRDELDLNPFRLNAQARVGYGDFTLFASYALTEMFQRNTGKPQLYPINFGVSFGG